jgi:tetratricopeptide (TPR) repeat protein
MTDYKMLRKDMLKAEVEKELSGRAEFTKIDMLERYLKLMPPLEMRKFAYLKLAEIYLGRRMFSDAAKAFSGAAVNCLTFREKVECLMQEAKAYVTSGDFDSADKALKKALVETEERNRRKVYDEMISYYKKEAERNEKEGKIGQASKIYEKIIKMKITDQEKEEVKLKLEKIYERLGKVKELRFLRGL